MRLQTSIVPMFAGLLRFSACGGDLPGPPIVLSAGDLTVAVQPADGTFDVARGGIVVLRGATADALIDRGEGPELVTLGDGRCDPTLGGGALRCVVDDLVLRLTFELASPPHLIWALFHWGANRDHTTMPPRIS